MKDSIFAIYDKEMRKINKNENKMLIIKNLSEVEKYIISIINNFKVVTFSQIISIINIEERKYTIDIVKKSIIKLLNNNFIESSDVYSEEGIKQFTLYYILNKTYINEEEIINNYKNKNLIEIKKRLMGNEIIISFLRKLNNNIIDYEIDTKLISKRFSKMFIVEGANINIQKKDKKFNILYEIVRKEKDWKKKIVNKLKLYKSFYDELIINSKKILIFPQLVLVCEDDEHVKELIEEIIKEKCIISKLKLYISTDYMIKNDILNSIIEIKIDEKNNRYEKIYKKIKIE